jgi:hypothetical protein
METSLHERETVGVETFERAYRSSRQSRTVDAANVNGKVSGYLLMTATGECISTLLDEAESLRGQAQSLRERAKHLDDKGRRLVAAAAELVKPRRARRGG